MNPHLDFLLSVIYDRHRLDHPEHLADLRKSGLTDETIALQKITDVPPHMLDALLGMPTPKVQSAYLIPFPDPRGDWMPHVRVKVFPSYSTPKGTVKYLQPRESGVRIFFPLATLDAVRHGDADLYVVEGEKKALAVAQLGLAAVGICGIEGWHTAGAQALHPDLDDVGLEGRTVCVVPDGDWTTNPEVGRAVRRLGSALEARGARGELVKVPAGYKGIDDYLAATA